MTARADTGETPALVVHGLGFEYPDGTRALTDVSLEARAGEVVGILGPNGCGKTTLLRAIARAGGRPTPAIALQDRGTRPALVSDRPVFAGWLTAVENAIALLRMRGLPGEVATARALDALRRFDLAGAAGRPVHACSRGTVHRLGLAIGFASGAAHLLLDEPLAGLDPTARDLLVRWVRDSAAEGTCILLTTHDPAFAGVACDRVGFMSGGRLLALDRPASFLERLALDTRIEIEADPGAVDAGRLERLAPRLPGDVRGPQLEGGTAVFRTSQPAAALPELLSVWLGSGLEVTAVRIREPDLRDAYFAVTGARLATPESTR